MKLTDDNRESFINISVVIVCLALTIAFIMGVWAVMP